MLIFLNQELYSNIVLFAFIAIIGSGYTTDIESNVDDSTANEFLSQENNEAPLNDGLNLDLNNKFHHETFSQYVNVSQHPGELCNRVCVRGRQRICYFKFTLEYYQAMGVACGNCARGVEEDCNHPQCIVGDGWEKGVMSINRKIPGPAIQVCQDDLILVDVQNNAAGTAASIHWHGLHMVETPYMDGVPFLTQCPISFSTTFRYHYFATQPGTHFYHSHAGHQRVNGQYGPIIIRQPKSSASLVNFYDYDLPQHYIHISDWMHSYAEQYFPGLPSSSTNPDSVVINGRGVYTNPQTRQQTKVPPTVYYVTPGKRYRFRLINGVSHVCPFQIQIEKHNFSIIASDSFNVLPRQYDTLLTNSGERYDFILHANHTKGDFWIRVRGLGVCSARPIESFALLRYESNEVVEASQRPPFPKYEDLFPIGTYLNHPNATCSDGDNDHCISELSALEEDSELRKARPDHKFFLSFKNHAVPNQEIFEPGQYIHFANIISNLTVVGAVNNLSMVFPDYPPLTQPNDIDESQFCDDLYKPAKCAGKRLCPCFHRLKVKRNSIVELFIVDENESIGRLSHPFHLHGYRFMVVGMGQNPDGVPMTLKQIKQMERNNLLPRKYRNKSPPFKDTASIPSRGYVHLRFRADNPGFWFLHCHYEWHATIGMGVVIQVGNYNEMKRAPHGFPQCGNYTPRIPKF